MQPNKRKKVLIVEDDLDVRNTLAQVLEMDGFQTLSAKDGLEGLEKLNADPTTNVVLLDLMMPILNGEEFLAVVHADPSYKDAPLPIIVITAHDIGKTDLKGTAKVLRKPFSLEELLSAIENCA